jgi:IS30 family transposase
MANGSGAFRGGGLGFPRSRRLTCGVVGRRGRHWDRGLEMAKHKEFTVATDVKVYFCDPQSPWQRGSNENTNGLLRQYFPKNADLASYSQSDLNKVALRLNQRPRQTLGFQNPASKLQESVASTLRPPG